MAYAIDHQDLRRKLVQAAPAFPMRLATSPSSAATRHQRRNIPKSRPCEGTAGEAGYPEGLKPNDKRQPVSSWTGAVQSYLAAVGIKAK
jgi:hypothetical protein